MYAVVKTGWSYKFIDRPDNHTWFKYKREAVNYLKALQKRNPIQSFILVKRENLKIRYN